MKSPNPGGSFDPNRILVVDDSPDILSVTDAVLSSCGYNTIAASSGALALQIINVMPPALVILDVNMPEMDGYEVTKHIRSNSDWNWVPILLFTALSRSEAAVGLEYGADDIMRKPAQIDELLDKVSSLILGGRNQLQVG
jgi:DNA-binding response OmpR family regulator